MDYKINSQSVSRRSFIGNVSMGITALTISSNYSLFGEQRSSRKIRIGIIGGRFGSKFQFHEHPDCIVEAVSDLRPERREHLMKVYGCSKSYESLEKLILDPKIEAVFIATPAPDHVRHTIAALNAGKHVLCAVPVALSIEDCYKVRDAVKASGMIYMMAETSVYMQSTISVKQFYKEGLFGDIFSSAAEYNHPGIDVLWFENGKPTWRHGLPPLLYPTHCTSFLISVTGERLTSVSAFGWGDNSSLLKNNSYNNPFWNETAFFKTNKGFPCRVEVNWKGAFNEIERGEWRGSKMSFFSGLKRGDKHTIVRVADNIEKDTAGFEYKDNTVEVYDQTKWWNTEVLPVPLRHDTGHDGSHVFITHEFIDAIINNRQPVIDIYESLAYTVPGIVAHESALKGGETMDIPDFDN